ncbi:MAG: M48 family metalloprotease [Flavobacteriales bacterium]|nr:M48 family metalloprotease [Flavobacteriales bacterium]
MLNESIIGVWFVFLLMFGNAKGVNIEPLSDEYFQSVLSEISNAVGIVSEFEIVHFNDPNKSAAFVRSSLNGKRKIHINDAATNLDPSLHGDWPWRFVIAHEIGHFQNGHVFNSVSEIPEVALNSFNSKRRELEADYFGGYALGLMGGIRR